MRRLLIVALTITLFGALFAGPTAVASADRGRADRSADEPVLESAPAEVTGTTATGGEFEGEFRLERFTTDGERLFAVGRLTGTLTDETVANGRARDVSRRVTLPVTGASAEADASAVSGTTAAPSDEIVATIASTDTLEALPVQQQVCTILNLDLGPLDLNLLGLRVQLDEIHLDITAIPGAGNLLGNLLCAVAGLLDPLPGGGGGLGGLLGSLLQGIVDLLNQLLGGLG